MRGAQLPQYFLQHNVDLLQRIIIPKSDYPKAFRFKKSGSLGIAGALLDMLPAIQLHYQLLFKADEIDNVRRNRVLSSKLEAVKVAVFQLQPKPQLRVG